MAAPPAGGDLELSTFERAFAVAALRALEGGAAQFLASQGEESRGAELAAAARALEEGGGGALAREVARLDAAPPDGIERVHPSWWHRAPATSHPAARTFLDRAATAHLVAMPVPAADPSGLSLDTLEGLPAVALTELIAALGRRRVALAFSSSPPGALARLCARLGEPAASELLAETRSLRPDHDEVRAAQRSLFKLAVDAADPSSLFLLAGARWLAPSLAGRGGDRLRRVAQRLPEPIGRLLASQAGAPATLPEIAACARAVRELAAGA
ncbi:MAG: hypothetical protein EXR72_11800 [Myxococcales bacterium]|nr:hypothetical protein [Myxococcales bacterium]